MTQKRSIDVLLLAEDDEDHAFHIMNNLRNDGRLANEIHWVKDGQQVIDYMNKTGKYNKENAPLPGLILLDLKMPMLDGFEVLKILKFDDRFKTIPIIMLTTSNNAEDIKTGLALGANDYIVKPVIWSEFEKTIRSIGKYWIFVSDSGIVNKR